jgi:hypothetical protein
MKSDFDRKQLGAPVSYREASKNSTKSNWGIDNDTSTYNPVSTTKRDFIFRDASLYEKPATSKKEAHQKTSPYFLDENYLKMGKSGYVDAFVTHEAAPVFDQKSLYKNKSNVSFGNEEDSTRFESVMRSGLKEHKVMPSRDKTFEMDGKQSRNIYEWADSEKSDYKTVSQAAYQKPNLKKDEIATVDVNFVKDLKGTHFEVGASLFFFRTVDIFPIFLTVRNYRLETIQRDISKVNTDQVISQCLRIAQRPRKMMKLLK